MEVYKGYENPQLVISAEALKAGLDDETFCIVDTRPTYEYIRGHIPGALHLDLFGLSLIDTRKETYDTFMWMIAYLFQQRGLDPAKPIVWYEDISGTRASRGFWFCEYLGHAETRLLDGGFKAWLAADGPVSTAGGRTAGGTTLSNKSSTRRAYRCRCDPCPLKPRRFCAAGYTDR